MPLVDLEREELEAIAIELGAMRGSESSFEGGRPSLSLYNTACDKLRSALEQPESASLVEELVETLVEPVARGLYEAQEGTRFSAIELAPGAARSWDRRPKSVQESWRGSARRILKAASTTPPEDGAELVAVEDGLPGCPGTRQGAGGAYRCGRGGAYGFCAHHGAFETRSKAQSSLGVKG
jgi:hypothetical protein